MVIAESDLLLMFKKSFETYERLRHTFSDPAPGDSYSNKSLVQLDADMDALLKGTRIAGVKNNMVAARASAAATFGLANDAVVKHVLEYGLVISSPGADPDTLSFTQCWADLFRNYAENNKRVASRGLVFGPPVGAAANIGNGAVNRLNTDAWGFTMENQWADAKLVRCTRDSVAGTPLQEEEFEIRSASTAGRDALEETGSGKISDDPIVAISASRSQSYGIQNPSFSTSQPPAPTLAPTDLGGWLDDGGIDATRYQVFTDTPYRGFQGDTVPTYLRAVVNNFTLYQDVTLGGADFETDQAYYFHVAVRRQGLADGTFTFAFGRASASVNLATLPDNVWTLVKITGKGAWYKNFGQPGMRVSFTRSAGTTGDVDLDDLTLGVYQAFDKGLYAVVGGPTAFAVEDKFTFTDNEYNTASATVPVINQKWLWRSVGLYLPACPLAPSQPAGALAGAGAGNVDNGTHVYYTTYNDVNGIESALSPASAVVTVADKTVNGKVTVTRGALPAVTTPLASWNVYRSDAGTVTPGELVQAGIALGTASITDNLSDANLGADFGGQAVTFTD